MIDTIFNLFVVFIENISKVWDFLNDEWKFGVTIPVLDWRIGFDFVPIDIIGAGFLILLGALLIKALVPLL